MKDPCQYTDSPSNLRLGQKREISHIYSSIMGQRATSVQLGLKNTNIRPAQK